MLDDVIVFLSRNWINLVVGGVSLALLIGIIRLDLRVNGPQGRDDTPAGQDGWLAERRGDFIDPALRPGEGWGGQAMRQLGRILNYRGVYEFPAMVVWIIVMFLFVNYVIVSLFIDLIWGK